MAQHASPPPQEEATGQPPVTTGPRRFLPWALLLVLCAGALYVRTAPFVTQAFVPGQGTVLRDADSYYHARRAAWTARDFPSVPYEDPYLYHPGRGTICWSPGHDFALATVLRIGQAVGVDESSIEPAWCLVNPLLAVAACVLVFLATRRLFGIAEGLVAATLLALSPPHVAYSALCNLDHHAGISLGFALILFLAIRAFDQERAGRNPEALGLALGLAPLLHPGFVIVSLVFVGLAALALPRTRTTAPDARLSALTRLDRMFRVAAITGFLASTATPEGRALQIHFWTLSLFHALPPLAGWLLTRTALLAGRFSPGRLATVGVLGGLMVAALLQGDLPNALESGVRYTSGQHWFLEVQSESRSPFSMGFAFLMSSFTPLALALPAILAVLAVRGVRRFPDRPALLMVVVLAGVVLATAAAQYVFAPNAAVFTSILIAAGVVQAIRALSRWVARRRFGPDARPGPGRVQALVLLVILVAAMIPSLSELRDNHGLNMTRLHARDADAVARFIARATPPTRGRYDPSVRPEYAVFAHRDLGHHLNHRGQRPVVTNPFGAPASFLEHNKEFARFQLTTSPREAEALLKRFDAAYLVNSPLTLKEIDYYARMLGLSFERFVTEDPKGTVILQPALLKSMNARLYMFDGGVLQEGPDTLPALSFLRLIHESTSVMHLGPDRRFPKYQVYQVVAGARVGGTATPNSEVELRVPLRSAGGRALQYLDRTRAGADGTFGFRVPYASPTDGRFDVVATGPVEIRSDGRRILTEVQEVGVLQGQAQSVGDLRNAPEAP